MQATIGTTAGDGAATEHWTGRALDLLEEAPRPDGETLRVTAGALREAKVEVIEV